MADSIYRDLRDLLADGTRVAVATIVHTAGSVPREIGAKMLIRPDGRTAGTVGGGCGEAEVMRAALDVIRQGQATLVRVDLSNEVALDSDGICGGTLDVLVEAWPPANEEVAHWSRLLDALLEAGQANRGVALLTSLPPAASRHVLLYEDGTIIGQLPAEGAITGARLLAARRSGSLPPASAEGTAWFVEVQQARPTLLIAGGGHIALPLVQMGALLDFRVVVLDDRPSFANRARFPLADRVICGLFEPTLRQFPVDRDTYVVIVTRGHQHDVECLLAVLDSPAAYIGMIGSRRRVRGVFDLLEHERGIDPARLRRVHSPIGLTIGARTPAEIAVSILAEVIGVYRKDPKGLEGL